MFHGSMPQHCDFYSVKNVFYPFQQACECEGRSHVSDCREGDFVSLCPFAHLLVFTLAQFLAVYIPLACERQTSVRENRKESMNRLSVSVPQKVKEELFKIWGHMARSKRGLYAYV